MNFVQGQTYRRRDIHDEYAGQQQGGISTPAQHPLVFLFSGELGGLLSFHVSFQCKRWQASVGPAIIREFRGAMMGRADKGLVITTSNFTREAIREATRDGAAAIDLVDGEQVLDMLKELGLGISTRQIEEMTVDREWFESI